MVMLFLAPPRLMETTLTLSPWQILVAMNLVQET
jgi:hypothetical protein